MKVTIWGSRGSLPSSGPETQRFGGNTSCVEISNEDTLLIFDAGSGIRRLGHGLSHHYFRIDIFLTHLHMDHIQGLGFFEPLYQAGREIHIWGPASNSDSLPFRLTRYLSPPLFPVRIRDLPCKLHFHEVPEEEIRLGDFRIQGSPICHPGPTVGYRIQEGKHVLTYLPDHEPALGVKPFPIAPEWTSGYNLALEADLLIHDAQFTPKEYQSRVGWGHSTYGHALAFAEITRAKNLILFHHDPDHTDEDLEQYFRDYVVRDSPPFPVSLAKEGQTFVLAD